MILAALLPLLLSGALALAAPGAAPVPKCRLQDAEVESFIASKARELRSAESCQFRRYDAEDDVDADHVEDFIVLFTFEGPDGGNFHRSFMAVYLSSRKPGEPPLFVKTGERGERDPVAISVRGGRIHLETELYLPKDPMCCPTGKGELVYEIEKGKLRRVKP